MEVLEDPLVLSPNCLVGTPSGNTAFLPLRRVNHKVVLRHGWGKEILAFLVVLREPLVPVPFILVGIFVACDLSVHGLLVLCLKAEMKALEGVPGCMSRCTSCPRASHMKCLSNIIFQSRADFPARATVQSRRLHHASNPWNAAWASFKALNF